jgi:four helix bundle protein
MTENANSENHYSEKTKEKNTRNFKLYDLEERTYHFARKVNDYVNVLPSTLSNKENGRQLVRSGGSIGANYIEANEALGKKDFLMKIKISKKESKESRYWLRLTNPNNGNISEQNELIQESTELMKIFGSILKKSIKNQFKLKY